VDDYQASQAQLDAKVQQWKSQVDQQLAKLETQKKQLDNERVLLTDELIREREEELQIIETEILDYQQKRFGPNGDLMIQRKQLAQPVQDQIFTAVQEIATSKKYDFILINLQMLLCFTPLIVMIFLNKFYERSTEHLNANN
jgi:Skp family chaperone for outer membrane proteins